MATDILREDTPAGELVVARYMVSEELAESVNAGSRVGYQITLGNQYVCLPGAMLGHVITRIAGAELDLARERMGKGGMANG